MGKTRQINIKNGTYYFSNDRFGPQNFDAKWLKTDRKKKRLTFVTLVL